MFLQKVYFQEFSASDFQDICLSSHLWKMHGMQFRWHPDPLHKPQWRVIWRSVIWRSGWLWKNDKMVIGLHKVFLVFMSKYFKIIFPLPFISILSPQLNPLGFRCQLKWMMHWFDSIFVVKKFWKLSRKLWIKDLTALLGSQNCSMSSQSQIHPIFIESELFWRYSWIQNTTVQVHNKNRSKPIISVKVPRFSTGPKKLALIL